MGHSHVYLKNIIKERKGLKGNAFLNDVFSW